MPVLPYLRLCNETEEKERSLEQANCSRLKQVSICSKEMIKGVFISEDEEKTQKIMTKRV